MLYNISEPIIGLLKMLFTELDSNPNPNCPTIPNPNPNPTYCSVTNSEFIVTSVKVFWHDIYLPHHTAIHYLASKNEGVL